MLQIPTSPRQKLAFDEAHRLRREAFAALIHAVTRKAGPRPEAGPKLPRLRASGEVLRPVCGDC